MQKPLIFHQVYNPDARKIVEYMPFVDTSDYQYGHGTHVAGTVAGKRATDGVSESTGLSDGVAPGAKIAFADIGNAAGNLQLPNDYDLLSVGRPYSKIHSASWGSELPYYTTQSRNFDQYMYENDDCKLGHYVKVNMKQSWFMIFSLRF